MKNFRFQSSIVLIIGSLFFLSCKHTHHGSFQKYEKQFLQEKDVSTLIDSTNTTLYKAYFDVYKHHLSGLLYVKPTENKSYRVVFLTEVGMKFFDIEIFEDTYKVHYAVEYLDKKILWKLLQNDFNSLLTNALIGKEICIPTNQKFHHHRKEKTYYYLNSDNQFAKIEKRSRFRVKMFVYLRDYQEKFPFEIEIEHKNIDVNIKLIKIKR